MKNILIVDDEPDISSTLKKGLELQGLKVDAFTDPEAALKNFAPEKYETVILDIRMPKMNGFQLYKEIMRRDDKARVIFLTAFEEYREEFKKAFPELDEGSFLKKPISIRELKQRVVDGAGR